jgi:hypothetical protein
MWAAKPTHTPSLLLLLFGEDGEREIHYIKHTRCFSTPPIPTPSS